jgi:FkbM family methyltransferase
MGLRQSLRKWLKDRGHRLPGWLLRDDEPFIRSVAETLTRDDTVIDLGAHVGTASIEFSHRAGRVYAFEPHPGIFAMLRANVARYPRIVPIEKAVSAETGTAHLYFEEPDRKSRTFEGSTLVTDKSNISYEHAVEVQTVSLADFVLSLDGDVALIKMDVEGAEYRILAPLLESPAIHRIRRIYVEDHCDRVAGLAAERAAVEARAAELGVADKLDLTWP